LAQVAQAARQEAQVIRVPLDQVLFLVVLHLLAAGMELGLITGLAAALAALAEGQAARQQVYIMAALHPPQGKEMQAAATALPETLIRLLVVAAQGQSVLLVLVRSAAQAVAVRLRQLAVLL